MRVKLCEEDWPRCMAKPHPGDLTRFLSPVRERGERDPYWYRRPQFGSDPLKLAPRDAGAYGVIHFDRHPVNREAFYAACRVLDVDRDASDFVAYGDDRGWPDEPRYLQQLRLVGNEALDALFQAADNRDLAELQEQEVTVGEALDDFIEEARERYGPGSYPRELEGTLGGDGDSDRETIAFGFMVESQRYKVYRIWTRAWKVAK